MSRTVLRGTTMYLTRKTQGIDLSLKLDKCLPNDVLYVLYDVKVGTTVIIPKGTAVMGDWVTETMPIIGAQLQLSKIFINGQSQDIIADSDVFCTTTTYNINEVSNANVVQGVLTYLSTANMARRIVNVKCRTKVLEDSSLNEQITYLNIKTSEIPVTLLEDFSA